MLAVHGLWSPGRGLLLWAEDSDRTVKSPSQALRAARPHPFAATAPALAELHPGKPATATVLLPSLRSAPLDSAELVRATLRPAPQRPPALLPWSVPAIVVDPAELDEPAAHARYGASVTHLRAVAALAADLTERGRVLPALVRESGAPTARWRPVVTGPDAVRLHSLVAAMPPVARAEQEGRAGTAGQDPAGLVADALAAMVDVSVRETLARSSEPVALLPPRRGRRPRQVPVAEQWLAALTAADGRFPADAGLDDDAVAALADELAGWDEVGVGSVGPARAMFRLAEALPDDRPAALLAASPAPAETSGVRSSAGGPAEPGATPWRLEFWLQSADDPSLQVPADQVWAAPEGLQRWISEPQEVLLAELGRASSVYPELAAALRRSRPAACDLDVEGAHHFLAHAAALLDAAGFGVQLPSWWDRRGRLGLVASARSAPAEEAVVAGGMNRETLADFEWSLAVGDNVLTEDEIAELVAAKAPLVRLRGQWVAIDPERLRRGLEFLAKAPSEPVSAAEVLALAHTHPDDLDLPLPVTAVHATGWLGDLLAGSADRTLRPVEPPATFTAQLRPYQQRGLSWLAFLSGLGLGACLADDMGLGKTVQLLALEARERDGDQQCSSHPAGYRPPAPTLLLCPMSLVGNWCREAARFAPGLRVYAHHGPDRCHGDELTARLTEVDLVVSTYATATRDVDELAEVSWRRLVLDEAQAIKNSLTSAAKAVRRLSAGHRVALTGTPVENRLAELWSVMDVLNPGILGPSDAFRSRYAVPIERHGDPDAAGLLRRITRPYLLRRVKTDPTVIDDLPEKIEIRQDYRLTTEQASLYRTVVDDMMDKIEGSDGIERRGNVLAAMAKLKQVCNHPAQLLHDGSRIGARSGKVNRLEEILDEVVAEDDKVLCFTQFTEFGEMLVPHLSARFDQEVLFLHGGTSRARRDEMVSRFQSAGGPSIFLLSLKAGGTGLNLTAANHVVHLDRWWNPAVENQATDRAFRIGQRRTVQVRKFCAAGTLEERIDAMIDAKLALAEMVISDGEGWLTELSTTELRELFTLGAEAVDE
ncbi:MAG: SNF2-related protein [Pseudonocardia sp.]|nr:SNF2-related protein [Pseudonocardia sp.]